jgi:hypothetical protein
MGKIVRDSISVLAHAFGYEVYKRTPRPDLLRLIEDLRPKNLGHCLIRIGAAGDGGYLVPDDLEGISCCVSPGVAESASFEMDLQRRGIPSILADASVEHPPPNASGMPFERRFIGLHDEGVMTTLDAWVARHDCCVSGDLLLQMDIEGAEWTVLANVSSALLRRFRIIVLELHQLDLAACPIVHRWMRSVLDRLDLIFEVAHVHPNNAGTIRRIAGLEIPSTLEITLLRRDRVRHRGGLAQLPNPLDVPNDPNRSDISLASWLNM